MGALEIKKNFLGDWRGARSPAFKDLGHPPPRYLAAWLGSLTGPYLDKVGAALTKSLIFLGLLWTIGRLDHPVPNIGACHELGC
jgi:hypothetical protein